MDAEHMGVSRSSLLGIRSRAPRNTQATSRTTRTTRHSSSNTEEA